MALLVAITFFMEILDGTIIATAAPAMAVHLQVAPVDINIAMTAYLITIAVGIPVSGWLTDKLGGRRIFMVAVALFTVASVLCALSTSLPMLCVMRVLQGLGGAMMVPVGRLVVLRATAKRDLLDAIAYLTWPALIAPVVAPAVGGWLVTYASWHWIFLINIPLGLAALVAAWRLVPALRTEQVPALDWLGFVLCGTALAALLLGIEGLGGHGWLPAIGLIMLAVALGFGTVLRMRGAAYPLLDFAALRVRTFRVSNGSGMVYRLVINAAPFVLPLMFQVGFGWSAVDAGFMVLMLFAGNVLIKPATSPLIRRFGFRTVIVGSALGGAVMFALCALLQPGTPAVLIAAVLFLSGVFRSIGFSGYNSLQFADISDAQMAGANTLSSTVGQVAAALGVAFGALSLRLGDGLLSSVAPNLGPVASYQFAFAAMAVAMVYPVVGALVALHHTAGHEVAGGRK
ncbi:MFS transporter [Microlunatus panaciterrae]|nr:MFS transporter [Microlunatus panaciterrae]